METEVFSPCGLVCNDCKWYKGEKDPHCLGCKAVEGKPFWGTCLTFSCAQKHGVENCGKCTDFPCKDFMERFDPTEGPENSLMRAGLLAYRVKHGEKAAIEILRKAEEYAPP